MYLVKLCPQIQISTCIEQVPGVKEHPVVIRSEGGGDDDESGPKYQREFIRTQFFHNSRHQSYRSDHRNHSQYIQGHGQAANNRNHNLNPFNNKHPHHHHHPKYQQPFDSPASDQPKMATKGRRVNYDHFNYHQKQHTVHQHYLHIDPWSLLQATAEDTIRSPFDDALRKKDVEKARNLIHLSQDFDDFMVNNRPRMNLAQMAKDSGPGDKFFSDCLLLMISSGIYPVTNDFMYHVVTEFNTANIKAVLKAVPENGKILNGDGSSQQIGGYDEKLMIYRPKVQTNGPESGKASNNPILHQAVVRGDLDIVTQLVERFNFDPNAFDEMRQTPVFHYIQGECPLTCFCPNTSPVCRHQELRFIQPEAQAISDPKVIFSVQIQQCGYK